VCFESSDCPVGADLLEDCSMLMDRRRRKHGRQNCSCVQGK